MADVELLRGFAADRATVEQGTDTLVGDVAGVDGMTQARPEEDEAGGWTQLRGVGIEKSPFVARGRSSYIGGARPFSVDVRSVTDLPQVEEAGNLGPTIELRRGFDKS